jgi:hypothetical protein
MISASDSHVLSLLTRANKMGAKGMQVIAYIAPQNASDNPEGTFVVKTPDITCASDRSWYDE